MSNFFVPNYQNNLKKFKIYNSFWFLSVDPTSGLIYARSHPV